MKKKTIVIAFVLGMLSSICCGGLRAQNDAFFNGVGGVETSELQRQALQLIQAFLDITLLVVLGMMPVRVCHLRVLMLMAHLMAVVCSFLQVQEQHIAILEEREKTMITDKPMYMRKSVILLTTFIMILVLSQCKKESLVESNQGESKTVLVKCEIPINNNGKSDFGNLLEIGI